VGRAGLSGLNFVSLFNYHDLRVGVDMHIFLFLAFVLWVVGSFGIPKAMAEKLIDGPRLEVVAELEQRPANIAVSVDGQVVVSFHPFDQPSTKIVMINKEGVIEPFPNKEWNERSEPGADGIGFVNVAGLRADVNGTILVLDVGDEKHAPRILEFNLRGQAVSGVRYIPRNYTTEQTDLRDFAYDWETGHAYIVDMGQADLTKPAQPAIIDLDMRSGWVRRAFVHFDGLMPPEAAVKIHGKVLNIEKDGKEIPVRAGLNAVTIDVLQDYLYFAPMGAGKLYRVPLSKMADLSVSEEAVIKRIEVVGDKPESDGMTVDSAGNVYLASIGRNEIGVITSVGRYLSYIQSEMLQWADGFSFAPDGYIYVTISRLNEHPVFNQGKDTAEKKPYLIVRFKPIAEGSIGH